MIPAWDSSLVVLEGVATAIDVLDVNPEIRGQVVWASAADSNGRTETAKAWSEWSIRILLK